MLLKFQSKELQKKHPAMHKHLAEFESIGYAAKSQFSENVVLSLENPCETVIALNKVSVDEHWFLSTANSAKLIELCGTLNTFCDTKYSLIFVEKVPPADQLDVAAYVKLFEEPVSHLLDFHETFLQKNFKELYFSINNITPPTRKPKRAGLFRWTRNAKRRRI